MSGKLSVIVVGRNEAKTLGAVFSRFQELSARLGGAARLIYVDSDSTDSSVPMARTFRQENPGCDVRIIRIRGEVNAAVARNVGMRFLDPETEFVFFLDGDIVFDVDFVLEATGVLRQQENVASVCGVIMDSYDGTDTNLFVRPSARTGRSEVLRWHGGNFVTRKAILDQVGPFDEALLRHEDTDYAFRMRNQGYILRHLDRRIGVHHTTAYLNQGRLWRDLRRGNFLYSGLLFRKHLFSRRCPDVLRAVFGVVFRCCVICCAMLSVFSYAFAMVALAGIVAVLVRTSAARRESLLARALSFAAGIQFCLGLFSIRRRQVFEVQVMQ